jgi:hypothetical protein
MMILDAMRATVARCYGKVYPSQLAKKLALTESMKYTLYDEFIFDCSRLEPESF